MTTGEIIRAFRTETGMTQEELGEALGVQKSAIQKYENGSVVNLKLDVIRRLCTFFRVPPWLFIFPEAVNPEMAEREDFYKTIESMYNCFDTADFMFNISKLTVEGREKLFSYASDLTLIKKYRSDFDVIAKPYLENEKGRET